MKNSTVFSHLIDEYGSLEQGTGGKKGNATSMGSDHPNRKTDTALMQEEERIIGAVAWETYSKYLRFAGGLSWAPTILLLLVLNQGATGNFFPRIISNCLPNTPFKVGNYLFLGFWTASS
jgi:ATP-binding cassette subfamily C (CFTR/MRP) protein 1